jgi:hypothetical protein
MNILSLENQIKKAEESLFAKELSLDEKNRFQVASYNSFKAHLDELRSHLRELQNKREKEILEVRFIGEKAIDGSLPLILHAKLSAGLADSLTALSTRLKKPKNNPNTKNEAELDLRLAKIVSGSTKFVLSLEINPDLFGWSLSQNTLKEWFNFFSHLDSPNELSEASVQLGTKGVNGIKKLLSTLKMNQLDLEIAWDSHLNEKYYWMGTNSKIANALAFLDELMISQPVESTLTGVIHALDRGGKLSLIDSDNKVYRIHFDRNLMQEIEKLHINQNVTIKTLMRSTNHPALDTTIENYDFIEIL